VAVVAAREVFPRSFRHPLSGDATAERNFVLTLDNPQTGLQEQISAAGVSHGSLHPEFPFMECVDASIEAGTPDAYHSTITASYLPVKEIQQANPIVRPDVWSFSTAGAAVPALVAYDENDELFPLVNAAGDFFEGVTTEEAELRATITGNRAVFPLAQAANLTNTLNNATYLGGDEFTWKCSGISGSQRFELVESQPLTYWEVAVELVYRPSGWRLQLPHVGWHYINEPGGQKFRVFVRDEETNTDVPASTPQPLDENGSLKYVGGASGPPDILLRRVNLTANFSTAFGVPSGVL